MDANLLLVDDDLRLGELLDEYFQGFGWQLQRHTHGEGVPAVIARCNPDLVILDMMLPGQDGLEVLREIRLSSRLPVLMLTARGEEADRITGLELGADDYLPKPFNPRELHARIKAILRRVREQTTSADIAEASPQQTRLAQQGEALAYAGLRLLPGRRTLEISGHELELPEAAFRLLEVFMQRPEQVLDRDQIMNETRGRGFMAFERSIDVQVSKLRQLLSEHRDHRARIKTVWGRGYMLVDEPGQSQGADQSGADA